MNSKSTRIIAVGAAVVLLVVAAGAWLLFGGDPVDEVSLEAATESLVAVETRELPGDLTGDWVVDTESGEFDYQSATGSFVGFRIEEELASIGSTTAVGRTGDIGGGITIDDMTVTVAAFDIDLTTITTETSRRDDKVQTALETDEFPTASFVLTDKIELSEAALSGEPFETTGVGELTIHGTTKTIEMAMEAQLVDGTVVIVGSADITFSDYGVEVPESQVVVSVDDFGVLELQLLLVRN